MISGSIGIGIDSSADVDSGTGRAAHTDIDKDVEVVFPKEN